MHQGHVSRRLKDLGEPLVGDNAVHLVNVAEKGRSRTVSMTKSDLITIIANKPKFPWARPLCQHE